jgi:hypothetical protein
MARCAGTVQSFPGVVPIVSTAQPRSLNRHLLAIYHAVSIFLAPAVRTAMLVLLVTISGQMPHFILFDF